MHRRLVDTPMIAAVYARKEHGVDVDRNMRRMLKGGV